MSTTDLRQEPTTNTVVRADAFYEDIDPGIRFAVRVLHAHGIDTGQSCQGGDGHSYDRPTVDLWADEPTTGFAAVHALAQYGLAVRDIARHYDVRANELGPPFWRITFWESLHDRADDRPVFLWSYNADGAGSGDDRR